MKSNKIIPGTVLILLGVAFLLNNYDVIDIQWSNFIHLWPIFIVIAGINLIFANNKSNWATGLKLGVVVAGFGLILFGNFGDRYNFGPFSNFEFDNDDYSSNSLHNVERDKTFNEPYNDSIKVAQLKISGGATAFTLNDTTNQLFSAETKMLGTNYDNYTTRYNSDSLAVVTYKLKNTSNGKFKWHSKGKKSNTVTFKLNAAPVWDIKVETGAAKIDFDLTKFKVKNLELDGGAASFDVKLGQPLDVTTVDVSTGVSEVTINIPANAACRITKDTGLSSSDFDGFTKKADNSYETAGFSSAKNKMYIKLNGGVSDFKVKRY